MRHFFFLLLLAFSICGLRAQNTYLNASRPVDTTVVAPAEVRCAPLYRKSMVIIGDSYVRNHRRPVEETWHYLVAEKYQMTYYNYGKNGNCVAFDRTRRGFGIPMYVRYQEMVDDADYVVIVAGHNDADMIGSVDTTLTAEQNAVRHDSLLTEFRLRLAQLLDSLIEKYPSVRLAFITPWNVDRPGFSETMAAIREICGDYSVPLYDAARESGIHVRNEAFRRRYFQRANDTAHLNAAGHKHFMNKAETFLLGL